MDRFRISLATGWQYLCFRLHQVKKKKCVVSTGSQIYSCIADCNGQYLLVSMKKPIKDNLQEKLLVDFKMYSETLKSVC